MIYRIMWNDAHFDGDTAEMRRLVERYREWCRINHRNEGGIAFIDWLEEECSE